MRIDFPGEDQKPQLRKLWQEAFGDPEDFTDVFFRTGFSCRRCRCAVENGELAGALHWFEVFRNGAKLAYLYGVATAKAYRGSGICRMLMEDTAACLEAMGYDGLLLVPVNPEVARMYEKMGFFPWGTVTEFTCGAAAAGVRMERIGAADYETLKNRYLEDSGVAHSDEGMAFLEAYATLWAGDGWAAVIGLDGDSLICQELVGDASAAEGIVAAFGCRKGIFRRAGEGRSFSWYRPLKGKPAQPGHFALALD
jgi:GNAT superfamily N-acetyltransferase